MWLLDAHTRQLEEYIGDKIPPYAILSHRWGVEEVTFQDIKNTCATYKRGYKKIEFCCRQALQDSTAYGPRIGHVWVDTCCIDKTNFTELSEAINSMYQWYSGATVCYAFLEDVQSHNEENIVQSSWFTRGWTLQELLAPERVVFFDSNWLCLGTKIQLSKEVMKATDVPETAFTCKFNPERFSVADKMSWASLRQTTREEDKAYSLLGMFQVNMPLIYGEGNRAFRRLQEEILKNAQDLTIFAWSTSIPCPRTMNSSATFANSPEAFGHRGCRLHPFDIRSQERLQSVLYRLRVGLGNDELPSSSVSNIGISISLFMVPLSPGIYFVPLCTVCKLDSSAPSRLNGMLIRRTSRAGIYIRLRKWGMCLFPAPNACSWDCPRTVMLKHGQLEDLTTDKQNKFGFCVYEFKVEQTQDIDKSALFEISRFAHNPRRGQENCLRFCKKDVPCGILAMLQLDVPNLPVICLLFGQDSDFNPFCLAVCGGVDDAGREISELHVAVPHLRRMFDLAQEDEVIELVTFLQADNDNNNKATLATDGVEMGVMYRRGWVYEMDFRGLGLVTIEPDSHECFHRVYLNIRATLQTPSSMPNALFAVYGLANGETWRSRRLDGVHVELYVEGDVCEWRNTLAEIRWAHRLGGKYESLARRN